MYFEDFSIYSYHPSGAGENIVNIGWLEKGRPFKTCESANLILVEKLIQRFDDRVVRTRGFHQCGFCKKPRIPVIHTGKNGEKYSLGSAEFRIKSKSCEYTYAAPDLIIHYILEHNYCPPNDFIDSV